MILLNETGPNNAATAEKAPICCIMPSVSILIYISAILPLSRRITSMTLTIISFPEAGMPMNSPL